MNNAVSHRLDAETTRLDGLRERVRSASALVEERVSALVDLALTNPVHPLKKLKHLAQVTVGIVVTPAAWYVGEGGVPALRGLDIRPGRVDDDDLVQISHAGHAEHLKSRLQAGDVVVVRTGQAGAAAVVPPPWTELTALTYFSSDRVPRSTLVTWSTS